ncbi:hypothetical protein ABZ671_00455 [Micromonospora sp. NPDC006766]|uniref:hypothetical protein n=1 Tax=Micromonospora sp. NPDC006766 TaxID=3154778 RepID=UPI0033C9902A
MSGGGVRLPYTPGEARRSALGWRKASWLLFVLAAVLFALRLHGLDLLALVGWGLCRAVSAYRWGWRHGYHTHQGMPRRPAETGRGRRG